MAEDLIWALTRMTSSGDRSIHVLKTLQYPVPDGFRLPFETSHWLSRTNVGVRRSLLATLAVMLRPDQEEAVLCTSQTADKVLDFSRALSAVWNPQVGYSSIVSTGTTSGSGTITVSFSGAAFAAISQSVTYGPYSTPSSIAAHIAALITKNYLHYGLSARAFGPNIIYGGTAPLGTVGVTSGSSFTTDTSSTAATAAAAACYAIPSFPCLGLWPDYDTPRPYKQDGITETPRQHIMRKHILGAPTLGPPPNTVYANTVGATPDQLFSIVQTFNFNTVLRGNKAGGGGLEYTFPSVTIGGVTFGLIGKDAAGNELHTNFFVLSPDRCSAVTSFPIAP
jgi:hypothetical protein